MDNMQIYNADGSLLLDIPVDDSSVRFKEIMGDNNLTLKFSLPSYMEFPLRSWCEFKAERYTLLSPANFTKYHSQSYAYTLVLESAQSLLKSVRFKFFTIERNPGEPDRIVGAPKLKDSLTATPEDFVRLLADNMNFSSDPGWQVGECIDSDPVTIDFNHDTCFAFLQKIADAFETEWEVDNKTVHVRKVEKMKDSPVPLMYGYGNGILGGITRRQFDSSRVITRLWVQGGDRNINYATYGNDTLLLPKNNYFKYEDIDYRTDETGSYIERVTPLGAISEDSLDISKIYPHREGFVSEVFAVDDSKGFYDFTDSDIPDSLDYSKMIIPGETMSVVFQTGNIAGREFDASYDHAQKRFKLVPITDNGHILPQGALVPEAGDKYGVFHISLPQEYIDRAQIDARNETVKILFEKELPKYTYGWKLSGRYAKEKWGEIGGMLSPGYFIRFSDPQFMSEPLSIRIVSVKEYVNAPRSPELEISNNVTGRSISSVLNQIPTQEQATDRKDTEIREYAKRRWTDTQELIAGIIGMSDEFKENLLSSLVFEGMIFRAGAAALQYRFLGDDWNTSIEPDIYFNKTEKRFYCPASRIKHETLGIDGQKPYWVIPEYRTDALVDTATPYYLYLKCSKELSLIDGRLTGEGSFVISAEKIKIEDIDGFYMLWVAFINSENEENDRSFSTMYGLAELLPGQLTVDTIRSSDGGSYWKALKNQFKIGNADSSIDWNVTKQDTLTIKGLLNVLTSAVLAGWNFTNRDISSADGRFVLDGIAGLIKFMNVDKTKAIGLFSNLNNALSIITETDNFVAGVSGASTRIDPNGIQVQTGAANMRLYQRAAGGHVLEFSAINGSASFTVEFGATLNDIRMTIVGLPTSAQGLLSGQVWNDNGTIKIKT